MSHPDPTDSKDRRIDRRNLLRMGLLGLGGAAALLLPGAASAHPRGHHDDYDEWDDWSRRRGRGRRRGRLRGRGRRRAERDIGYYCKPCGLSCRHYDELAYHVHRVHRVPRWRLGVVLVFGGGGWYFYG